MVQPRRAFSCRALALACVLLLACITVGCLAAGAPHKPGVSFNPQFGHASGAALHNHGSVSLASNMGGGQAAGDSGGSGTRQLLSAPHLRPASRQLSAAVNGSQAVVGAASTSAVQQQLLAAGVDAVPVIPMDQLGWLTNPATWQVWEPPAEQKDERTDGGSIGGGGGAASIAAQPQTVDRGAVARARVVQQVTAHLDAASMLAALKLVAPDDVAAAATAASTAAGNAIALAAAVSAVPTEGRRRLLASGSTTAHQRRLSAEGEAPADPAASQLVSAAARKPRPIKKPVVLKPHYLPNVPKDGRTLRKLMQPNRPIQRPFNQKFPPSGMPRAPAPRRPGCLFSGSVKQRGVWARGDGRTNDALALARTNKMKGMRWLYFPVGTYRISTSLTLSKPVIMGANTRFLLDRGVKLTLLAAPKRAPLWYDPMFQGLGTVVMGRGVQEVFPAWWSSPKLGDGAILQKASAACANACTVVLTRPLSIKGVTTLAPGAGFFATTIAILFGWNSPTGEGLVLPAGNYMRPLVFTGIHTFKKWGLKIMPGVVNANIQAGQVSTSGDGIVFEGSPLRRTARVTFSHISVMQSNQHSIVFNSPKPNSHFEGVTVRLNFLLSGGMGDGMTKMPSSGVIFRGVPPILTQTQVVIQAIDPAQFRKKTKFVAAVTATKGPVDRFVFRSECWNGGYELPAGSQVDGSWTRSAFLINFADQVGGRVFHFLKGSSKNVVLNGDVGTVAAAGRFWNLAAAPGTLDMFRRANPAVGNEPPVPIKHKGFYVGLKTNFKWLPGQQRTFYMHSNFANPGVIPRTPDCVPFRDVNPGLKCVTIAVQPLPGSPNRVAISIMNLSRKVIQPGYYYRFGIQI